VSVVGKVFDGIDERLGRWIAAQPLYFVATAPLAGDGHVNVSPKGLDSFAVVDERTVAYLDLTGSGVETIAHLQENGRITVMFCAFTGPPRIVRLQGRGAVLLPGTEAYDELAPCFPEYKAARSIIRISLDRISDTCGFGVPRMTLEAPRDELLKWAERKDEETIERYKAKNNALSIDGLPGLPS
jgi:hypothetical protein